MASSFIKDALAWHVNKPQTKHTSVFIGIMMCIAWVGQFVSHWFCDRQSCIFADVYCGAVAAALVVLRVYVHGICWNWVRFFATSMGCTGCGESCWRFECLSQWHIFWFCLDNRVNDCLSSLYWNKPNAIQSFDLYINKLVYLL